MVYLPEPKLTVADVLTLKQCYATHKMSDQYKKKRVSWLVNAPKSSLPRVTINSAADSLAVVEHIGKYPECLPRVNTKPDRL